MKIETFSMRNLVANKLVYIANFIESEYAKKLIQADVWNLELDEETLEPFLDYRYYPKFLEERKNRNASTTDRETAIIFGLPPSLIEGVFIGRKLENNKEDVEYIKSKLPDCYICNLDGVVIVGNM